MFLIEKLQVQISVIKKRIVKKFESKVGDESEKYSSRAVGLPLRFPFN